MSDGSIERLCYTIADFVTQRESEQLCPGSSVTKSVPVANMDPGLVYLNYLRQHGEDTSGWVMKNGELKRRMDKQPTCSQNCDS